MFTDTIEIETKPVRQFYAVEKISQAIVSRLTVAGQRMRIGIAEAEYTDFEHWISNL
jgi:hypothetical protein